MFKPIGPYSHIVRRGNFIAISGTPAVDNDTAQIVSGGAYNQSRKIIQNMRQMLELENCSLKDVLHVNVYLKNVEDFAEMNKAYAEEFGDYLPARTVVAIADLPKKDALLTMSLTAVKLI